MPTLLKDVNLCIITYIPLIMKWGVPLIWHFIVGHFWLICQKIMIFTKMKKNSDLPYAYSVKRCQPIYNYSIYVTDSKMGC